MPDLRYRRRVFLPNIRLVGLLAGRSSDILIPDHDFLRTFTHAVNFPRAYIVSFSIFPFLSFVCVVGRNKTFRPAAITLPASDTSRRQRPFRFRTGPPFLYLLKLAIAGTAAVVGCPCSRPPNTAPYGRCMYVCRPIPICPFVIDFLVLPLPLWFYMGDLAWELFLRQYAIDCLLSCDVVVVQFHYSGIVFVSAHIWSASTRPMDCVHSNSDLCVGFDTVRTSLGPQEYRDWVRLFRIAHDCNDLLKTTRELMFIISAFIVLLTEISGPGIYKIPPLGCEIAVKPSEAPMIPRIFLVDLAHRDRKIAYSEIQMLLFRAPHISQAACLARCGIIEAN